MDQLDKIPDTKPQPEVAIEADAAPQGDSQQPATPKEPLRRKPDAQFWGIYVVLVLVSLFELYSASIQQVEPGNILGPLFRHGQFILIGLALILLIQHFHYRYIYYLTPLYVIGTVVVMGLVLVVGTKINGAQRGLKFGPLTILPAEMLKLAVALGIAWIVTRFQIKGTHDISDRGVKICAVFVLLCCGLLVAHGLTNTLLVALISVTMMGVGFGGRKFWTFIALLGVLGTAFVGYKTLAPDNKPVTAREQRIADLNQEPIVTNQGSDRGKTWFARIDRHLRLNKYNDTINDENKQELLSYIAQARGGMWGVGIGNSRENTRLPLAYSDYVFAIVVEELGLWIAILVLALYIWLLLRAGRLATQFKSTLPSLLVIGCSVVIVYQALFHMAIVTGVFPVSGQPLPLLSQGGTSVIVTSIAFGVMLSVSRFAARRDDPEEVARADREALPENALKDNPVELTKK